MSTCEGIKGDHLKQLNITSSDNPPLFKQQLLRNGEK